MADVVSVVPVLASLALVDLLAAITPGPNFVLVAHTAIHRSRTDAAMVVGGFAVSNLLWCLAVLLGLSTLFELAPWLYGVMKILGGSYLVYLGVRLWLKRGAPDLDAAASGARTTSFTSGLVTNLSNPKSAVYFGSIFTLAIGPGTPAWVWTAAIGIVMTNTVIWYGAVAWLFSGAEMRKRYAVVARPITRAAGAVMAGLGVKLLVTSE